MNRKLYLVNSVLFVAFIAALTVAWIVTPDREFSGRENRTLAQAPALSAQTLFSGKFMTNFEKYVSDQFAGRDSWITLKAAVEVALGKTENNNVYFARYGMLIERFAEPDAELVRTNIAAVRTFAERLRERNVPVYFTLVPGAVSVYRDLLPANAPNADQNAIIALANSELEDVATIINTSGAISEYSPDINLYFRTDHHWNARGAYFGYIAVAEAMELPQYRSMFSYSTLNFASKNFYGTTYSSSGAGWVKPDELEVPIPDPGVTALDYNTGKAVETTLYHPEKLETKNKYEYFLGGNSPQRVFLTGLEAPKILIIRDSYMDIELPYFLEHFSELHLLDLRYFNRQSALSYALEGDFDMVLISYSVKDFAEDRTIKLLELE